MKSLTAISPLIDHLITVHKSHDRSRDRWHGRHLRQRARHQRRRFERRQLSAVELNEPYKNQDVLDTLVQLADGVDFEYDVAAWKQWYAGRKKAHTFNGRRDD